METNEKKAFLEELQKAPEIYVIMSVCTKMPYVYCEPESYEGGELVIEDTYGQHRVKLPAGHLVLYPASSLHCVTPVTRGVRQASFLWIQSMVRDDKQRAMLYDLDRTIQSLKARFGDGEEVLSLLNMYHNLLRQWTEV